MIFMPDMMRVTCSASKELRQEALMMDALSVTRHIVVTRGSSGGRALQRRNSDGKCHQSGPGLRSS